jgi:O-antigen/teichoic acid export membrane protein
LQKAWNLRGETGWVLAGQGIAFVGSFLGIKILTGMLGPKGYGELALGLTIAGLFNMYLYGPLANVVARFFSVYRERGDLAVYFGVLKKSHLLLAVSLTVLAALIGLILWPWLGLDWALIGVIATLYASQPGSMPLMSLCRAPSGSARWWRCTRGPMSGFEPGWQFFLCTLLVPMALVPYWGTCWGLF